MDIGLPAYTGPRDAESNVDDRIYIRLNILGR